MKSYQGTFAAGRRRLAGRCLTLRVPHRRVREPLLALLELGGSLGGGYLFFFVRIQNRLVHFRQMHSFVFQGFFYAILIDWRKWVREGFNEKSWNSRGY